MRTKKEYFASIKIIFDILHNSRFENSLQQTKFNNNDRYKAIGCGNTVTFNLM